MGFDFLYNIPDVNIVDISAVNASDFFMKCARSLTEERSRYLINQFNEIRRERYGLGGILPAEYSHEYNMICEDWQRKILLVGVKDDIVVVVLKKVQMFKYVYTRMEGLPISLSDNHTNELKVLLSFFDNEVTNKISCLPDEGKILERNGFELSEKIDSYNFYSHIPNNFEKINVNKWKHKKGIFRCEKMKNLSFHILGDDLTKVKQDYIDMEYLNDGFSRWKEQVGGISKGWHRIAKGTLNYKYWLNKDHVIYYMFRYKDIPVGLVVYVLIDDTLTHQIINKAAGRAIYDESKLNLFEDELVEFNWAKKRLNAYIHYKTLEDLNSRGLIHGYFGGAFSMASLRKYKQIMNDIEIEHCVYKYKDK